MSAESARAWREAHPDKLRKYNAAYYLMRTKKKREAIRKAKEAEAKARLKGKP